MDKPQVSKVLLYGVMLGMFLCGTANTLLGAGILAATSETKVDGVKYTCVFNQPYFVTMVMFVGESMCWLFLFIKKAYYGRKVDQGVAIPMSPGTEQAKQVKQKTNINPLWIAIPACCDVFGTTIMNVALVMMPTGIWQMMRGMIVPICAFFSICFLGKKQYRHHWVAIVMIVGGIAFVGWVSIHYDHKHPSDDASESGSVAFGMVLVFISQLFAGCQFISEEKILGDYYLDPFQIVGTEGMWGLAIYVLLLPVMQYIQCGSPGAGGMQSLCSYGFLENSAFVFEQVSNNNKIIGFFVCYGCSIAAFNSFGIATTKYASAAQRSTIDSCRQLSVWLLSHFIFGDPLEPLCLIGYFFVIFGTLWYNEIFEIPFCGFADNTKRAISLREGGSGKANADFMQSSPAAAYDSRRNQRALQKKMNGMDAEGDDFDLNDTHMSETTSKQPENKGNNQYAYYNDDQ